MTSTSTQEFHGVIPAIVTPTTNSGDVDVAQLAELTRQLIDAGVHGILACGSTGEFSSLSVAQRKVVVATVCDTAAGQVPVMALTSALSMADTIELSRHAESCGVSAALALTPFELPLSWREVLSFYRSLSDAVSIPLAIYHIPLTTNVTFTLEQLGELGQVRGVRYIKESSGDGELLAGLIEHQIAGGPRVLAAADPLMFAALASGAAGVISGPANVAPRLFVELYDAMRTGELTRARALWSLIYQYCRYLYANVSAYPSALKAAMRLTGFDPGGPFPPRLPLDASEEPALEAVVAPLRPWIKVTATVPAGDAV
jgi:4-hydroxy-tetrahydrodipicolinate synthase